MKATWINNSVEYVQWNGNNLCEVKDFVEKKSCGVSKVFLSTDGTNELYITGIGIVRQNSYLCHNCSYKYNQIEVHSWKTFPWLVNEDVDPGLIV